MNDEELESWMETSAQLVGIKIPADCRPGVLENLQRNFSIAEKLMSFRLAEDIEMAPIFKA